MTENNGKSIPAITHEKKKRKKEKKPDLNMNRLNLPINHSSNSLCYRYCYRIFSSFFIVFVIFHYIIVRSHFKLTLPIRTISSACKAIFFRRNPGKPVRAHKDDNGEKEERRNNNNIFFIIGMAERVVIKKRAGYRWIGYPTHLRYR